MSHEGAPLPITSEGVGFAYPSSSHDPRSNSARRANPNPSMTMALDLGVLLGPKRPRYP